MRTATLQRYRRRVARRFFRGPRKMPSRNGASNPSSATANPSKPPASSISASRFNSWLSVKFFRAATFCTGLPPNVFSYQQLPSIVLSRRFLPLRRRLGPLRNHIFVLRNHFPLLRNLSFVLRNHFPLLRNHFPLLRNRFPLLRNRFPLLRNHLPLLR